MSFDFWLKKEKAFCFHIFNVFILWLLQCTIVFCDQRVWKIIRADEMYPNVWYELSQLRRHLVFTTVNMMKVLY